MSNLLSPFPVGSTGKGLRSFDILGSGCVSSVYESSVQSEPSHGNGEMAIQGVG